MATIAIRNIGPIKEAKFDLNKVNIFMGPQSSGKSTLAKIISYCTWVEKDVATNQSLKKYRDNDTLLRDQIELFHKIKGYFRPDSYISYKGDVLEVIWENERGTLNWIDQYAYKRSKISYIPAERNMVILPEARKVELGNTNIRSFLFDWFDARKKYTQDENLPILNLEMDYYYSEGNDEDHIADVNGDYDIFLSNASSGLQSITPLVLMIDYLTYWIYKEEKISFDQEEKRREAEGLLLMEKVLKPYAGKELSDPIEIRDVIKEFTDKQENASNARKLLKDLNKLRDNLFSTKNIQFVIEEPEQNLFPETQRDLVYYLLEKCLNREGNRLTITTHSPYVLYALNNCMMGYLIKDTMPKDEQKIICSKDSWINPKLVSVWEIENGIVRPIKNTETGTVSKHYFNKIMNDIMEEYYDMLTFLKVDKHER